ncbi:TPA: hypothetical protein JGR88_23825 [Salmonella enterica subsp. enterica serovar Typhimurium]|nr:hypothetical protein [Salmonella enterica subsp. enterica serovar Typhimurium]
MNTGAGDRGRAFIALFQPLNPDTQYLTLADRQWQCPVCGAEHHRDINAAVNIAARAV